MEIDITIKRYRMEITDDGDPILMEDPNGSVCLAKDLVLVETLAKHLPTVSMMYREELKRNTELTRILSSISPVSFDDF